MKGERVLDLLRVQMDQAGLGVPSGGKARSRDPSPKVLKAAVRTRSIPARNNSTYQGTHATHGKNLKHLRLKYAYISIIKHKT